ncbi:hypothetical protein DH2020_022589 [Rehmannia glutinosa]|uniref:RCC1-like domain-containing protein n=1 Tax=Rehmannia glutinosa TaxID=99300 RepID=A0ABR0W686_REHGL
MACSGENGAGKTKTAKIAMQYLVHLVEVCGIESEVLQTSCVRRPLVMLKQLGMATPVDFSKALDATFNALDVNPEFRVVAPNGQNLYSLPHFLKHLPIVIKNRSPSGFLIGLVRRWMSTKTTVMSFGDGSQGALGLAASPVGLGVDAYEPTPIPGLPPDVCSVSAGHYHSLAVTSQGHVWTWGRNSESQLGRGQLSPRKTWNKPQKVEGLDQVRALAAFASGVVSAAIGDDGTLWVWGNSKRGQLGLGKDITEAVLPSRVEKLLGHEIVKVSLGWGHALALTKDGKLFGWGYYADGRLGKIGKSLEASPLDSIAGKVKSSGENSNLMIETAEQLVLEAIEKEKDMPIIWEPTLIEELCDVEVVDVACGLDLSLILCSDGTLLSGGSNVYGQLGRLNDDLGLHVVDMSLRPISIASGLGHSLAICKNMSSEAVKR